ncbi:hypothetical protein [Micromonospora sp. NPDC049679]|uniref:hypothetical protein n=1 Tax=Micromonospora sp. NPDC049679 TaxID=3155920 RepID=UPI0033C5D223
MSTAPAAGHLSPAALRPLYAAGFVTAFGAHSIAASLGALTTEQHASLLALGLLPPSAARYSSAPSPR